MNRAEMQMAIDPVCGMTVDPNAGKPSYAHGGQTYHFCSDGCRLKFAADPDRYLNKSGRAGAAAERHALHLPDASADRAGGSRTLPDLRHGARADGRAAGA